MSVFVAYDDRVPPDLRAAISTFLEKAEWRAGWKSDHRDAYSFLHAHFAGAWHPDHWGAEQRECADELPNVLVHLWDTIQGIMPAAHLTLLRCYANLYPFGSDGTLHTDSTRADSWTWIYYPHKMWSPNWGGETLFYDDNNEIIGAAYPKPGRLIVFDGTVKHIGRGVTRLCPVSRVTLMLKTSLKSS